MSPPAGSGGEKRDGATGAGGGGGEGGGVLSSFYVMIQYEGVGGEIHQNTDKCCLRGHVAK